MPVGMLSFKDKMALVQRNKLQQTKANLLLNEKVFTGF